MVRIHPIPTYRYQCSQAGNSFGLLPFVKLRQLVRAQKKEELRIGMGSSNVPERIHGVRRALPVQLHLTHPKEGVLGHCSPSHFHSAGGRRQDVPKLMGRKTSHQKEKAIQGEPLCHLLCHQEMAKMGRIKGASEKAQAQGGHASEGPFEASRSLSPNHFCSL